MDLLGRGRRRRGSWQPGSVAVIETGRWSVLEVEPWAGLRRKHFGRGVSIRDLSRRYGIGRNTLRRELRSHGPPRYERPVRASKLEPFKDEIHRLLRADPKLSGVRIRELIEPLGFDGQKTIVDDYLREVRPLFLPRRMGADI